MPKHARIAAKRDTSEPEIVEVLEKAGCTVFKLDQPVDLLVGLRGEIYLIECKTGKRKLRPSQIRFIETWKGRKPDILRSADEAVEWVNSRARYSEDDLTRHHFGDS